MQSTTARLEALIAKIHALPLHRQEQIVEWLAEATDEPYRLSHDELSAVLPELEGARRGEFADRAAVDAVLNVPWVKQSAPND